MTIERADYLDNNNDKLYRVVHIKDKKIIAVPSEYRHKEVLVKSMEEFGEEWEMISYEKAQKERANWMNTVIGLTFGMSTVALIIAGVLSALLCILLGIGLALPRVIPMIQDTRLRRNAIIRSKDIERIEKSGVSIPL